MESTSQRWPRKPDGQRHWKALLSVSRHSPPCKQGLLAQAPSSVSHSVPVYPAKQEQMGLPSLTCLKERWERLLPNSSSIDHSYKSVEGAAWGGGDGIGGGTRQGYGFLCLDGALAASWLGNIMTPDHPKSRGAAPIVDQLARSSILTLFNTRVCFSK